MEMLYHIPIVTCGVSIVFSFVLWRHFREKPHALHILWWFIGILNYGARTLTESINALVVWSKVNFRLWYITGALLGGAPLAQDTVYLMRSPKKKPMP